VYISHKKVNFDVIGSGTLLYQCPIKGKGDWRCTFGFRYAFTAWTGKLLPL
jgi:hypothetical protein